MPTIPARLHNPPGDSLAVTLARSGQLESFYASLTAKEKANLAYDWKNFWARPKQLPPRNPWFVWFLMMGRGCGKSRTGAEWGRMKARTERVGCFVAPVAADIRRVMVEGVSGIMNICSKAEGPKYEPTKSQITFKNGAKIMLYSADEPDRLRGPEHYWAWVDEPTSWNYLDDAWSNLLYGLRLGMRPQICATSTPRAIPWLKDMIQRHTTVTTTGSSDENKENLAESFFTETIEQYVGTRLERQERYAEILEDAPGAIWNLDNINQFRAGREPGAKYPVPEDFYRVVIAIDPNISSKTGSDECGMVAVGATRDPEGRIEAYVLADLSIPNAKPEQWGRRALDAFNTYNADFIIGEINQGGEMVEHTIRTCLFDNEIMPPFEAVHASRGKQTRAQPFAAPYVQGRVHHVGVLPKLEDEMITWEPGMPSPNHMDALVWALAFIFPNLANAKFAGGVGGTRGQSNPDSRLMNPVGHSIDIRALQAPSLRDSWAANALGIWTPPTH